MRHLILLRIDSAAYEARTPIPASLDAAMGELIGEWTQSGTLLLAEGLRPTSEGKRVRVGKRGPVVSDGPFTESKEVIGGFFLLRTEGDEHAVALASKLVELHAREIGPDFVLECEVRRIDGSELDAS